jgi:hypothetical protein
MGLYTIALYTKICGWVFYGNTFGRGRDFWMKNSANSPTDEPLLLAELSTEETKFYILNNIEEFETEDIVATLALDEIVAFQEKYPSLRKNKKHQN